MSEKNRRLLQGEDVIYPITKQENVIGLQKTITDKLPIVSGTEPSQGFAEKQIWLDTSDESEEVIEENYNVQRSVSQVQEVEENNYGDENDVVEENYEGEN